MAVTFEEFKKLDIRIARIKKIEDHPNADKLYLVTAEIGLNQQGESTEKTFIAGIKNFYSKEQLEGKLAVVLTNLAPAVIRGVTSDAMLLAASYNDKEQLVILAPDRPIPVGSKVS